MEIVIWDEVGANEALKRGFEKEFQKGNSPHESNLDFVQQ